MRAVLFAGVLARYVFHAPLVWSDEVASIVFLWLGILGSGQLGRMLALAAAQLLPQGFLPAIQEGAQPFRQAPQRAATTGSSVIWKRGRSRTRITSST